MRFQSRSWRGPLTASLLQTAPSCRLSGKLALTQVRMLIHFFCVQFCPYYGCIVFSVQQGQSVRPASDGCGSIALLSVGEGEALISLRYGKLREELKLFSYAPLQLQSPSQLIVAVGTAAPIVVRLLSCYYCPKCF